MIQGKTSIFSKHLEVKNYNPQFYSATIIQTQHLRRETVFIQFTYIRIYILHIDNII